MRTRIAHTSLRRAIVGPERLDYLKIWLHGRHVAQQWARRVASSYFSFQTYWPQVMSSLWGDASLAEQMVKMGTPAGMGGEQK